MRLGSETWAPCDRHDDHIAFANRAAGGCGDGCRSPHHRQQPRIESLIVQIADHTGRPRCGKLAIGHCGAARAVVDRALAFQRSTEIKIGNTAPYRGPLSAYSVIPRTEAAYFRMLNEQGGINGHKINFISLDDGYRPPKTVEQIRRLVELEGVAFVFNFAQHAD